jgi:hypothetical protein
MLGALFVLQGAVEPPPFSVPIQRGLSATPRSLLLPTSPPSSSSSPPPPKHTPFPPPPPDLHPWCCRRPWPLHPAVGTNAPRSGTKRRVGGLSPPPLTAPSQPRPRPRPSLVPPAAAAAVGEGVAGRHWWTKGWRWTVRASVLPPRSPPRMAASQLWRMPLLQRSVARPQSARRSLAAHVRVDILWLADFGLIPVVACASLCV